MKRIYPVLFLFIAVMSNISLFGQNSNVGIGTTTPDASAVLDVTSNTQGMLVPRLTTTQRLAIASPAQGLLVYDTNLGCFYYYNSTTSAWVSLCQAGPAGPTGPQGTAGLNGPTGPSGTDGLTGPTGASGSNGASGPSGADGASGTDGATGATGPTGPGGTGSLGPSGPQGTTGATGPIGVTGAIGTIGATGPQGNAGTNGTPGVTGPSGVAGATGPAGPTGTASAVNIQSVSLTTDVTLPATTFTNLPGLTLTFTPTKTQTFIEFTAAGTGATDYATEAAVFQVLVNGTAVGGSATIASTTDFYGNTIYVWTVAFSKLVTVNANVANTVTVQYYSNAVEGNTGLVIHAATETFEHGTLSAFVQ